MRDECTNRWPKFRSERTAVWPRVKETSDVVNEKVESAFRNVKSFPLKSIIFQFWQPVKTTAGARVLSCSRTPFAVSPVNHRLRKYRSRSSKYYYGLNEVDDPMIIARAPPIAAFLKLFPEVILDLRVHRGTPLVDLALECELTCFMMLPLFYQTSCVGVIEVSVRLPRHLLVIFNELQLEIKRVGLSITPNPQNVKAFSRPSKGITGDWKLASSEAAKALHVACESHAITLGQLWIPYECYQEITLCQAWIPYENFHSKMTMKRSLLGKLRSYCVVNSDGTSLVKVKRFYHDLYYLPLKMGEGLIGRTLETRQPHLCRNIYKLSENRGELAVLSAANTKCTCFVICLRSSHTGEELDYVFEFFWPQSHNHLALMEALLLTLRQHLPSFKYASGAQLGGELLVVDVENSSSGSGNTLVKIFPGNKSSDKRASMGVKRKTRASVRMERESVEAQSVLNQANQYPLANINNPKGEDAGDDDDLVILAVYKVDQRLFFLPSSPTFESLMEKINQEFELNPAGTYKIEYQVLPGEWCSLTDDTCLKSCISSYWASKNIDHIKLCVRAVG